MNLIINFFTRLIQNPKTTLAGVFSGGTLSLAASAVLDQAGCQLSQIQWWEIMGIIFGGPAAVGGMSTDNGSSVTPAITIPSSKTIGSWLAGIAILGLLAGCASSDLLPNGMYAHQFKAERQSCLGTNTAATRMAQCPQDLTKLQDWTPEYAEAVKQCQWVQSEWHDSASQGQCGQIIGGAAQGAGIGVAGQLIGNGGEAAVSATSSATATGGKGH